MRLSPQELQFRVKNSDPPSHLVCVVTLKQTLVEPAGYLEPAVSQDWWSEKLKPSRISTPLKKRVSGEPGLVVCSRVPFGDDAFVAQTIAEDALARPCVVCSLTSAYYMYVHSSVGTLIGSSSSRQLGGELCHLHDSWMCGQVPFRASVASFVVAASTSSSRHQLVTWYEKHHQLIIHSFASRSGRQVRWLESQTCWAQERVNTH